MEKTTLVAPDISCEHCQHAIEGAVGKVEGVKTVHIEYDPQQVTLEKIEEVMDDVGYTVAK